MHYTKIAVAKPFEGAPKINMPSCYGASPQKPVLFKIPVTGQRPVTYKAFNLPDGLTLSDGIITGQVKDEGDYTVTLVAENVWGRDEKELILEIHKDKVLLTPLLGFTTWNAFGFPVTQEQAEFAANKMTSLGISEYGYSYINIDSGWQGTYGGKYDAIMPNKKFPDMKGFCDRMHALGYKCGIYSTPMLHAFGCSIKAVPLPPGCTCGEPDDRFADERGGIGVIRKEKNNALQWADWGFDYLKYDWRPSDPYNAELMRKELIETDRDFGFCVTIVARPEYHTYWEKYCNSYRCNVDSLGDWDNFLKIYKSYFDFIDFINKGHYFDLDMLDLGQCSVFTNTYNKPDYGYTEDEQIVLYTLRAIAASPIQISTNFEAFNDFELSVYCNEEVIAINQDCGAHAAKPCMLMESGKKIIHVLKKKLHNGDDAYVVFNLGETVEDVKIYLDEMAEIRDVWAKENLDNAEAIVLNDMQPHTARMFRVKPLTA
ncbi:MAG: putative Ig domain-containing protein [Clostridia bacterium]|nr:putative Ig domain-containing protein [Clostridia bacterium]